MIIAVTILMILLCAGISVNHVKTLSRIMFGTGITALVLAALFQAPKVVSTTLSETEQRAAVAVAGFLLHNLQIATIVLGVVCLVHAFGSKVLAKPKV
jgi:hypothetical protein